MEVMGGDVEYLCWELGFLGWDLGFSGWVLESMSKDKGFLSW